MKTDSYLPFEPRIDPDGAGQPADLWFVVHDKSLMVKTNGQQIEIPRYEELLEYRSQLSDVMFLGKLRGRGCYAARLTAADSVKGPFEFLGFRAVVTGLSEELFSVASKALHLVQWNIGHRFCCRCGAATKDKPHERAKECPACGHIGYPRISPAIIVAVSRGRELLLAHSKKGRPGFYSVLAGFVEPGESFEQCVRREVFEEVGLEVKNIRYFGSQPWPFPDSLMVGFTADYARGEIHPDGLEIETAAWYPPENLPQIPPVGSISRKLIDRFVQKHLL
jgi:NAD+ diphosphatase